MYECPNCKREAVGRSPTGSWCNACGWMSPCPCDAKLYCPFHSGHEHVWDARGYCEVERCPAKQGFADPNYTQEEESK
jgi:hypothetical protein